MHRNTWESILARLVQKDDGCLVWTGTITPAGYGRVGYLGRYWMVHRLVFETYCGPIPPGMRLHHECRNRACANVDHLQIVTDRQNILAGEAPAAQAARRTHCRYGHLLQGDNLRIKPNRGNPIGTRICRTCQIERNARSRSQNREKRRTQAALYRDRNRERLRISNREAMRACRARKKEKSKPLPS